MTPSRPQSSTIQSLKNSAKNTSAKNSKDKINASKDVIPEHEQSPAPTQISNTKSQSELLIVEDLPVDPIEAYLKTSLDEEDNAANIADIEDYPDSDDEIAPTMDEQSSYSHNLVLSEGKQEDDDEDSDTSDIFIYEKTEPAPVVLETENDSPRRSKEWTVIQKFLKDNVLSTFKSNEERESSNRYNQKMKEFKKVADLVLTKQAEKKSLETEHTLIKNSLAELQVEYERYLRSKQHKNEANVSATLKELRDLFTVDRESVRFEKEMSLKKNILEQTEKNIFELQKELTKLEVSHAKLQDEVCKMPTTETTLFEEQRIIASYKASIENQTLERVIKFEKEKYKKSKQKVAKFDHEQHVANENTNKYIQNGMMYLKEKRRKRIEEKRLAQEKKERLFQNKLQVLKSVDKSKEEISKLQDKRLTRMKELGYKFSDEYHSSNIAMTEEDYKTYRMKIFKFEKFVQKRKVQKEEKKLKIVASILEKADREQHLEALQRDAAKKYIRWNQNYQKKLDERNLKIALENQKRLDIMNENIKIENSKRILQNAPLMTVNFNAGKSSDTEDQGLSFTCKPSVVVFKDFEVGKVYKKKVILTNISFHVNSFKIHRIPIEVEDLIKVDYSPPGPLSPGLTWPVTIEFHAKEQEDLITKVQFLSATGQFPVPIECYTQKCIPVLLSKSSQANLASDESPSGCILEVDSCGFGETSSRFFKIQNNGVLSSRFKVIHVSDLQNEDEDNLVLDDFDVPLDLEKRNAESNQVLSFNISEGQYNTLEGYATTKFKVEFSPKEVGVIQEEFFIMFERPGIESIRFTLKSYGKEKPVYVDTTEIDLGICNETDKLGHASIMLHNRGGLPYRFVLEGPKSLCNINCLDFSPNSAYIQANSSFELKVKVKPNQQFRESSYVTQYQNLEKRDRNSFHASFKVPIRISFNGQLPAIPIQLSGQVTAMSVLVEPEELDFGMCDVNERVTINMKISNTSLLDQSVKFMKIVKHLEIDPIYTTQFTKIKAGEQLKIPISFYALKEGKYSGKVALQTNSKSNYFVPFQTKVSEIPIKLSKKFLNVGNLTTWDEKMVSVILFNNSIETCKYFIDIPHLPNVTLKIHPSSGEIEKNGKVLLNVCASLPIKYILPEVKDLDSFSGTPTPKFKSRANSRASQSGSARRSSVAAGDVVRVSSKTILFDPASNSSKPDLHQSFSRKSLLPEEPLSNSSSAGRKRSTTFRGSRKSIAVPDVTTPTGDEFSIDPSLGDTKVETWPLITKESRSINVPILLRYETADKKGYSHHGGLVLTLDVIVNSPNFETECSIQDPNGDPRKLRFGGIPTETKVIETIHIENKSNKEISLSTQPFNPLGPFNLITTLSSKIIKPNQTLPLKISYEPRHEKNEIDYFEIISEEQSIKFTVSGHGIKGQYHLDPEEELVSFGETTVHETVTKTFNVINDCVGTLRGSIKLERGMKKTIGKEKDVIETHFDNDGDQVFKVTENSLVLTPGNKKEVAVTFCAPEERLDYECYLVLTVQGCESKTLKLKGKSTKKEKKGK
jgi:hypothetical protein